ncbi:asparagine synthase-related protein [Haladaptatus sp. ZSTT2]|uniref:asparagine synthase-related protein n=1 Tax=Haladaptatus sp. ZSTT2 TaxID=3120515 RepID=UPI00300EA49F
MRATEQTEVATRASMNTELFGVFGTQSDFERFRSVKEFDEVVSETEATVGIRSHSLDIRGCSSSYSDSDGTCIIFGEAYPAGESSPNTAHWLLDQFSTAGMDALSQLNGSYLAYIEHAGESVVVTDPIRSWECYYADVGGARVFSTDIAMLKHLVANPTPNRTAVLEFLHLGTVLGTKTLFEEIRRVPIDSYLTATTTESLSRFVYDPQEFDYVTELADRLQRAVHLRSHFPGKKGILLSGGKDSRVFLSQLPDISQTYTIGRNESREVRVAKKIAHQYNAEHTVLEPSDRYLSTSDEKLRYSQSIKEALHIHHAGYDDLLDVDVMYHGLLFDTLFKGYFLEWDGMEVLGSKLPSTTLVRDPDPVDSLLATLGYFPTPSEHMASLVEQVFPTLDLDHVSPRKFLETQLSEELSRCWERTDSVHNAMDLLVISNQPVMPFRTQLADNYFEPFVAIDTTLLDWHLKTPPEYRNSETFRKALERIDPNILHHRPPSQPHDSNKLNQLERFIRRKLPFVEEFEPAWPDRNQIYADYGLAEKLFPNQPAVHALPVRLQLRIHNTHWWLDR